MKEMVWNEGEGDTLMPSSSLRWVERYKKTAEPISAETVRKRRMEMADHQKRRRREAFEFAFGSWM